MENNTPIRDEEKSPEQLLAEVRTLRERVAMLEARAVQYQQREAQLHAAKAYTVTVINSSLDMIVAVDSQRRITEFNPAAEQAFGYDKTAVLGQPVDILYETPSQGAFLHEQILLAGGITAEVRNKRKNGEIFDAYLEASVLRDATGHLVGVVGIIRDVSERTRAHETQARLTAILEGTLDCVGISVPGGQMVYLNRAGRQLLGIGEDEPLSEVNVLDFHPEHVRTQLSEIVPILITEGQWSGESTILTRDGRYVPVSQVVLAHKGADGLVQFFSTIIRDISVQKNIETALRESEEQYRNLFENANDAIATFSLSNELTSLNRGGERLLGWPRDELIGQYAAKVTSAVSMAYIEERTRRFLAGDKPASSTFEMEFIHKDGHIIPVEARTRAIRDRTGQPTGFQGIYRDISAKKALERQRNDFLAMLAHDIKNPLAAILGYVDLLQQDPPEQGDALEQEFVQRIRENAQAILSLVTNYLDLARAEAGNLVLQKTSLSLDVILRRVVQQYAGIAQRHHVNVLLHVAENLPRIVADGMALERAFANLVRNALKFTPETGSILINVLQGQLSVNSPQSGDASRKNAIRESHVVIEITDTGPGIAAKDIPLLFEKYRQTPASRTPDSTGLGLFVVKTFVEAHGGHVEVESTLGVGSCFRIILPVES